MRGSASAISLILGLLAPFAALAEAPCSGRTPTALTAPAEAICGALDKSDADRNGGATGDKILQVPDLTQSASNDPRRCDVSRNMVAVRDNGELRDVYRRGTFEPDDRFVIPDLPFATQRDCYIEPVIKALQEQVATRYHAQGDKGAVRILIFAHGGLVSHHDAVLGAEALAPMMVRDGYVPLFLVWNSDFPVTYGERLCCVAQGEKTNGFDPTWFWNVPTRLFGDVVASVARAPENYGEQLQRWDQGVIEHSNKYYYLAPGDVAQDCRYFTGGEPGCRNLVFPEFDPSLPDYATLLNADNYQTLEKAAEYTLTYPFRVGVTAVGPQVGAAAWDNMVRRTRIAFDNDGYETSCQPQPDWSIVQTRECWKGGFTRFFDALLGEVAFDRSEPLRPLRYKLRMADHTTFIPVHIEFYGHSMGAIVGDELIHRYPDDLPWTRIVYMAAAVSMRDFERTAAPVIVRRHVPFYTDSLHPLSETRELNYWGVPPEGSLLEWIDAMFEGPRTRDDRMIGKWKNLEATLPARDRDLLRMMTVRVFPHQSNLRTSSNQAERDLFTAECSPDAAPGGPEPIVCFPEKHGEFTYFSFWRPMYFAGPNNAPPPMDDAFLSEFHSATR